MNKYIEKIARTTKVSHANHMYHVAKKYEKEIDVVKSVAEGHLQSEAKSRAKRKLNHKLKKYRIKVD
jgi:hypothetical protein